MFNYRHLALAIASIGVVGTANAAGLDRSGQDVTAFLQDGTYGEVVYTYIEASVSGQDTSGNAISNMAEAYDSARFGIKADINDTFSVGVLYDEPWGAAIEYRGNNNFVSDKDKTTAMMVNTAATVLGSSPLLSDAQKAQIGAMVPTITSVAVAKGTAQQLNASGDPTMQYVAGKLNGIATSAESTHGQGTNVEIRTQNATLLMGAKLGQNKNFQIYGGPQIQRLTGEVHLRGTAYGAMTGYDARIGADTSYGWVAGVAYHKPEIALKAALTYRSEIDHERSIAEVVPALALRDRDTAITQPFSVTLPESWNLDFQTGINPTTLLTAKVRYVPWSDFNITPPQYSNTIKASNPASFPNGLPIVRYSDDQWSAEVGLGKKLNDKLAVQGSVGYDSGAGNPVSTLGPIKGYYSVGLGGKYNITPEWSVSLGAKYFKFGDAVAQIPTQVGTDGSVARFEDNDGYAVGVKLAYQKK